MKSDFRTVKVSGDCSANDALTGTLTSIDYHFVAVACDPVGAEQYCGNIYGDQLLHVNGSNQSISGGSIVVHKGN